MKLLIKANSGINGCKISKNRDGSIEGVEIDFKKSDIWSDLEMWLDNDNGDYKDYAKMIISNRDKMKLYKS